MFKLIQGLLVFILISGISYAGSSLPETPPPSIEELQNKKEMQIQKDKTEIEKLKLNNQHAAEMQQSKQLHERQVIQIQGEIEKEKLILIYALSVVAFVLVSIFITYIFIKIRDAKLKMQENEMKKEIMMEAVKRGYITQEQKQKLRELSGSKNNPPKLINGRVDPKF